MDGWLGGVGWEGEVVGGWVGSWVGGWVAGWLGGSLSGWLDGCLWVDGWMDGEVIDGCMYALCLETCMDEMMAAVAVLTTSLLQTLSDTRSLVVVCSDSGQCDSTHLRRGGGSLIILDS